jgi:MFS superfamily sulfate permease-like transporter
VVLIGFIFSLAYFLIVRYATKAVIYVTAIMQVAMGLVTAIIYFARHNYAPAVLFLLFTIFYVFCFFSWRKRIPFSVLMLQTIIDVSKNYGHVFLVSAIGGLVTTLFSIYFSITLVGIYAKYHPGGSSCGTNGENCSTAKVAGLIVFITFAAFWITEVIKNVIHVTISGVYGSWYFCSRKPSGFPRGATTGAFKRATTYSFGSISFGSLVVAIIQFLRQACTVAQAEEGAEKNIAGMIAGCFLGCIINFLDWLVEFINEYAFSYIALYGKAYVPAAKVCLSLLSR